MSDQTLNTLMCAEYEEILTGKRRGFSNALLKKFNNYKYYVPFLQYVFEEMLRWTPADVNAHATMNVIRALKIDQIICLMDIPKEIDLEEDAFFLSSIIYPELYPYDYTTAILTEYKRKLKEDGEGKIKKGFFDDEKGRYAAQICLHYAIDTYLPLVSSEKRYQFFADITNANQFFKIFKLRNAFLIHYETPIEYLHDSLKPRERSDLFYWYYLFRKQFDEDKREYQRMISEGEGEHLDADHRKRREIRAEKKRRLLRKKARARADKNMQRKN